jgi:hypothetical protein
VPRDRVRARCFWIAVMTAGEPLVRTVAALIVGPASMTVATSRTSTATGGLA